MARARGKSDGWWNWKKPVVWVAVAEGSEGMRCVQLEGPGCDEPSRRRARPVASEAS